MLKNKKPKYAISPIDRIDSSKKNGNVKRFSKNKKYKIIELNIDHFYILDDCGNKCYCLFKNCSHINNKNWIIK